MSIQKLLLDSFKKYYSNNVLVVKDTIYTYCELNKTASYITNSITSLYQTPCNNPIVIMGTGSFFTHAGICGTILAGSYYVPLNEGFPKDRNISIINQSRAETIILDTADFSKYEEILSQISGYNIITNDENITKLNQKFNNTFYYYKDFVNTSNTPFQADNNSNVYLLFTSGTTGIPKGICITNFNLESYINAFIKRNKVLESDKFIQMNDLTFDLSAHSIFLSLLFGACLYIPDKSSRVNPAGFINKHKITHGLFVPSTLVFMKKMRSLKENIMPDMKYTAFCGEALPFDNALLYTKAAPNSKCENIYGPTEATIACSYFEFNSNTEKSNDFKNMMPIGYPNENMQISLLDNEYNITNHSGQIALSGNQLAKGYLNNIEQTKEKFVNIGGVNYYLTGDLGLITDNNNIVFLGRNDTQVQINGYRVELYEIENKIMKLNNILNAAAIAYPKDSTSHTGIILFIMAKDIDKNTIINYAKENLPHYMIPKDVIIMNSFPLNSNGKVDRNKLKDMI